MSRFLGGRLAAQLAADPSVERVIGIDTVAPQTLDLPVLGRTEYVRADIRNPLAAKVIAQARVTTVVHAALFSPASGPRVVSGRVAMQEMNVIGTMQLLAACQKSDTVQRLVLRSTTAVYGSGPRDPAVFTEDSPVLDSPRSGYVKDAVEIEGYLRGLSRRRPDIDVSVLRLAAVVGPTVDNALTRYLDTRLVPAPLGYDPRVQLLHEADAVEVLRLATVSPRPGVVNVAGDGVLTLSQLLRQLGRVRVGVPHGMLGAAASVLRNGGARELSGEEAGYLLHGRVVDTTALRERFAYSPRYDTAAAAAAFAGRHRSPNRIAPLAVGVGSRLVRSHRERHDVGV